MASSCDKFELSKYLELLDYQNKVVPTNEHNTRISKDVESIVVAIANEISSYDRRFQCFVIRSGSFYSGLKIGKADEFDFMFYLKYFSKEGVFKVESFDLINSLIELWVTPEYVNKFRDIVVEYKCSDTEDFEHTRSDMDLHSINKLDVGKFQRRYTSLLLNAIQSLDTNHKFPKGWHQSRYTEVDYLSKNAFGVKDTSRMSVGPNFWHGPSFTYEFEGLIEGINEVLKVNIDMCPVFSLQDKENSLEKCGFHLKVDENSWAYSNIMKSLKEQGLFLIPAQYREGGFCLPVWKISTVMLEDAVLQEFDHDSIELKSLRILKLLRKDHIKREPSIKEQNPFEFYSKILESKVSEPSAASDNTDNKPDDEEAKALKQIYQSYRSYTAAQATIHKTYKSYDEDKVCMVSSYQLKLEWLKYMILRDKKPALTNEDLVDTIFAILKNFLKFVETTDRSRGVFFNIPVSTPHTDEEKKLIITSINSLIQHLQIHFS